MLAEPCSSTSDVHPLYSTCMLFSTFTILLMSSLYVWGLILNPKYACMELLQHL